MPARTMAEWYQDGLELLDSGFYDSAVECFDSVLQSEPGNAEAWILKATALSGLENFDEALDCLDQALGIDPLNVEAWKQKASWLTRLGREDEAAQCELEVERITGGEVVVSRGEPSARIYGVTNGLASDTVEVIAADQREAWFAYEGGLGATRLVFQGQHLQTYTQTEGLISSVISCIVLTEAAAWLGTDKGLSRFDRETQDWRHFTEETGLQARAVNDVVADDKLLWLGTDSGLLVLDPTSGRSAVCEGGPEPMRIDCLLGDGNRLWCGANEEGGGMSVFDKQAETFQRLGAGHWVQGMGLFPRGAAQKLWVATKDGITIVDRTTYETDEVPLPTTLLTGMAVGVFDLLLGTGEGLATVDFEQTPSRDVEVTQTDIGRGQRVTALCATQSKEWIAIEGEGVLCLTYS